MDLATFRPLLDERLVVVDVGARWGCGEGWEGLGDDVEVIGFEPDETEAARLQAAAPANVRYLPVALGARSESRELFVTTERACASLYEPRADLVSVLPTLVVMTLEGTTRVNVQRLDEALAAAGIAQVDGLKIDVQGAELEVLEGSGRLLESMLVVDVEVEFNELYRGQPLFGDIDAFLRAAEFDLWRIRDLTHYSNGDLPGFEFDFVDRAHFDSRPGSESVGGGQLYWAMATYVRRGLVHSSAGELALRDRIRAAACAGGFGFDDLAQTVLGKARDASKGEDRASLEQLMGLAAG